jgi:hypothetical protein
VTIQGTQHGSDISAIRVLLFPANGTSAGIYHTYDVVATVTSVNPLTVNITGMSDRNAGQLTAWVIVNGVAAKAVIATVAAVNPLVATTCFCNRFGGSQHVRR